MRKINSTFKTSFISESGSYLINRDYYAYVELDKFACYVLADGLDEDTKKYSAELVVSTILQLFTQAPSMSKSAIKNYITAANKALYIAKGGLQLKASVTVAVTDYVEIRYSSIGNTRFALFRDDVFIEESKDQSLSEYLVSNERLSKDKVARHEERNNLYSYLGIDGTPYISVSPKLKISDGDVFLLYSRGIWENCEVGEIYDCIADIQEPIEIINGIEDIILSKQPENLDNYSVAVTVVSKTYRKPQKKWGLKRILMIAIPIATIVITLSVFLFVRYQKRVSQSRGMHLYIESAEKYIQFDNYSKASDDYNEALKLAKILKDTEKTKMIDISKKVTDQIIMADESNKNNDYQKAETEYYTALEMSLNNDNLGREYIENQVIRVGKISEVYALILAGDELLVLEDYKNARNRYVESRDLAGEIFFIDGRKEAIEKIAALDLKIAEIAKADKESAERKQDEEEARAKEAEIKAKEEQVKAKEEQEKLEKEEEEKAKADAQDAKINEENIRKTEASRASAVEFESKANGYYKVGDNINALLYYQSARVIYIDLGLVDRVAFVDEKIAELNSMNIEKTKKLILAKQYAETADVLVKEFKYREAQVLYRLALEIYTEFGDSDMISSVDRKLKSIEVLVQRY
jgi:hypothetical protein